MTKRTRRESLYDVDDVEPTPRPKRQRVRDPIDDADDDLPRRQYGHGESSSLSTYERNILLPRSGAGRPKGSTNLIPRKVTESFMEAVERLGSDGNGKDGMTGFFMRACAEQPAAALTFASRLLPRQVHTTPDPQSVLGQLMEAARARLEHEKAKTIDVLGRRN
jgi:hypothetical protein